MFEDRSVEIFSSRDKIRDQVIKYTKEYLELEGLDLSKTSYLSFLINTISALTANLLYYSTSTYREMFLTRAVQKESVLNLSAMLGYSPPWAIPATCSVLVGAKVDFSSDVFFIIPANHKYYAGNVLFSQNNTIYVEVTKDATGVISSTTVTEEVASGGTRSVKHQLVTTDDGNMLYFVVNLTQYHEEEFQFQVPELKPYEFHITSMNFTGQLADVKVVISEEWRKYDSLFLIPFDTKGYAFRRTETGGQIFFGNGIIGQQPESGQQYTVTLSVTDGLDGNVISGSINKADKIYIKDYDPNGNSIDDTGPHAGEPYIMKPLALTVVNTAPAYNGKDFPTLDEIRSAAIANVSSMKRLVSRTDYDNIHEIIPELPIQHAVNIIKRSDLKSNEIHLFTDILFEDTIVPTRNTKWIMDSTTSSEDFIYSTDTIEIDGTDYYSMFNISINPAFKTCSYYYLIDELEKAVVINNTSTGLTGVLPTYAKFEAITTDSGGNQLPTIQQELDIELHYDVLIPGSDTDLQCVMETGWDGLTHDMSQETVPSSNSILNGDFTSNTNSWACGGNDTITSVTGGVSGNCLKHETTGSDQYVYQTFTTISGKTYNASIYHKNDVGINSKIKIGAGIGNGDYYDITVNDSTSWIEYTTTFEATSTSTTITLYCPNSGSAYFDEISICGVNDEVVFRIPDNSPLQLSTIANGPQRFTFKMYFLTANPNYDPGQPVSPSNPEYIPDLPYLNECQVEVVVRDNLDDYMYSQVEVSGTPGDYDITVYDVPVIKKSYYDSIDQNNFTNQIYNKILTFDIVDYRMVSDFVNLKFSNTTGAMDNMKYNLPTKRDVAGINPISFSAIDTTTDGIRYVVSNDECGNPWDTDPWNRTPPFIAEYVGSTDNWVFERVSTNDMIYDIATSQKVLYNGCDLIVPVTSIPFQIRLIVWRDRTHSATAAAIVSNVKTFLIDALYRKFGFDKNIYRSEIIETVQSVPGVSHCKLVEPIHDIFFNYDIKKDLTQQELLEYSPQLIWFDSTTISIEVR